MTQTVIRVDNRNSLLFQFLSGNSPLLDAPLNFPQAVNSLAIVALKMPSAAAGTFPLVFFSFQPLSLNLAGLSPAVIPSNIQAIPLLNLNFDTLGAFYQQVLCLGYSTTGSQTDFRFPFSGGFINAWAIDVASGALVSAAGLELTIVGSTDLAQAGNPCR